MEPDRSRPNFNSAYGGDFACLCWVIKGWEEEPDEKRLTPGPRGREEGAEEGRGPGRLHE